MHSYISIHHLTPAAHFPPLASLRSSVTRAMAGKDVAARIGEEGAALMEQRIMDAMGVYYRLTGADLESPTSEPNGLLPRFVRSLTEYFATLEREYPPNKEISILRTSGVQTIKIRYKFTESVIKKLVKLGLRDLELLADPLKIFLRGGALHDLIGVLFVCTYPYEQAWVARSLYNFFYYPHRTDDHLLYGFYTVKKKSGYQALHCDETLFHPRFDETLSQAEPHHPIDPDAIFGLLEEGDDARTVLRKLSPYFNIEIQLRSRLENVWADMEHANSYNVLAKGSGRSDDITVQWRLLAESLKNIEAQLQQLQIDTEQSRFRDNRRTGYTFVMRMLRNYDPGALALFKKSIAHVQSLRENFIAHEISRRTYVHDLGEEAERIRHYANHHPNPLVMLIFRMQSAYIYYRLANHFEYFNHYDIRQFAHLALKAYSHIDNYFSTHREVCEEGALLHIIAILRYLRLGQKYGMGLVANANDGVESIELVSYSVQVRLFLHALQELNGLRESDLDYLREDNIAYIKIIHRFDVLAREWEIFSERAGMLESAQIAEEIARFRNRYLTKELVDYFHALLQRDKIKEAPFLVQFYATLIWHGLYLPLDALREIIRLSAYEEIAKSHLFRYELAAYRFLVLQRCESVDECAKPLQERQLSERKIRHYAHYHRENMIQLLFHIEREEPENIFLKAKIAFEKITGELFRIKQFSEILKNGRGN